MKDAEIIKDIRAGDYSRSAKHLYVYYPVVKKFVLSNSGRREDAEDIFQDALVILFGKVKASEFQLTSTLNTYLYSICKNLWHERLRRLNKELSTNKDLIGTLPDHDELIKSIEENSKTKKAFEAVALLGEKCRQLLTLFYFKKMSMALIAQQLRFSSEKLAKNQKYRCIEKAKEIYSSLN
ncbi:MAG: sigma-70 family RNA polymerase sigma factor [Bacteroidia bacterium]|nr:sigma-70 family RNA polymerase sigma factor [Bacteroidia bacterium]